MCANLLRGPHPVYIWIVKRFQRPATAVQGAWVRRWQLLWIRWQVLKHCVKLLTGLYIYIHNQYNTIKTCICAYIHISIYTDIDTHTHMYIYTVYTYMYISMLISFQVEGSPSISEVGFGGDDGKRGDLHCIYDYLWWFMRVSHSFTGFCLWFFMILWDLHSIYPPVK